MTADGYPDNWETQYPGPWPLGMPIWLDSWGPPPPLVHYGNGTDTPGPLLPIYYVANTTIEFNAGRGPALEPLPLTEMFVQKDAALTAKFRELAKNRPGWSTVSEGKNTMPPLGFNALAQYGSGPSYSNPGAFTGGFAGGFPGQPVNEISLGGAVGAAVGSVNCENLSGIAQYICRAGKAIYAGATAGSAGAAMAGGAAAMTNTPLVASNCPTGWVMVNGRCTNPAAAMPGGVPMTLTRNTPTTGGMGLTAVTPIQVGTISRADGSTGPILKCPARYVLGMDYLCYPKSMIPNQLRAHPRGTRPLLTGGDVKILRRAKSLEKKVSKLSTKYGKKTCHCGPKRVGRKK